MKGGTMAAKWKEIIRLKFNGARFNDHALAISALDELSQFQKIVTKTARELWRAANPTRSNVPPRFDERTQLYLRGEIAEGSAEVLLEACAEIREKDISSDMFDKEFEDVVKAVDFAQHVFETQEEKAPLPENLTQDLLAEYSKLGEGLGEDEAIEISPVWTRKQPPRVTRKTSDRLSLFKEDTHEDQVNVTGEVIEANVLAWRFQLRLDDNTVVTIPFTQVQEEEVTEALRFHRTQHLKVKGRGVFSPKGKLLRIIEVTEWQTQPAGEKVYDDTAPPIEEVLMELSKEVPKEEWKKLPPDLTDNIDHYLYGTPKK